MAEEKMSWTEVIVWVGAAVILTAVWAVWIFTDTKLWNWYVAAPFKIRALQFHEVAGLLALKFALFPSSKHTQKGSEAITESIALLLIIWTIVLAIRIAGY